MEAMEDEKESAVTSLQKALIEFYAENYTTICLSSFDGGYVAPVSDFYVKPPIKAFEPQQLLRKKNSNYASMQTDTTVTNYKQMLFGKDGTYYRNIYVTAKPGVGKTSFCKHLCAAWCEAHQPENVSSEQSEGDDIEALKLYKLAFFITLKEVDQSCCDVDEMIKDFIKYNLTANISAEILQEMLNSEQCLVVLDGLDEWTHPDECRRSNSAFDIPHRRYHKNYTIITTTRSWKFDIIHLESSQIDRHVMINMLDDRSSEVLVKNAVKILNKVVGSRMPVHNFNKTMATVNLGEILNIPYINLQCVCLWFDDQTIGESRCQIFTNILELTFSRGKGKVNHDISRQSTKLDNSLPSCFENKENCIQHSGLLLTLGKMAYNSIFNQKDEQMLVMDITFAEKYLKSEELDYCLSLGLLSRNKEYGHASKRVSYVEFHHRTVHEFFCALYMQSTNRRGNLSNENIADVPVPSFPTLGSLLRASAILIFLSGMDSQMCSQLFTTFTEEVSLDESFRVHRNSLSLLRDLRLYETIFRFQTLLTECAHEMELNGQKITQLPLEDIIVNKRSKKANYTESLQTLLCTNSSNVKSLMLEECESTDEVSEIIMAVDLLSIKNLVKLDITAVATEEHFLKILQQSRSTLKSLELEFRVYDGNKDSECKTNLSVDCTDLIVNMPLVHLSLACVLLSHHQWENIVTFIKSRANMKSVFLYGITCKDHKDACPGCVVDLSRHENLRIFGLADVPISRLYLNTSVLEEMRIGQLPLNVTTYCLQQIQGAQSLYLLACCSLQEDDLAVLIKTIPSLEQLEELYVFDTDLGDSRLTLTSNMKRLDYIHLGTVMLGSAALRDLTDTVQLVEKSVTVALIDCTVRPKIEYKKVKKEIRQSTKFSVNWDRTDKKTETVFQFQTIKENQTPEEV